MDLLDRFWTGLLAPRLPLVPSQVLEVLQHELDPGADLAAVDDLVQLAEVDVKVLDGGVGLKKSKHFY